MEHTRVAKRRRVIQTTLNLPNQRLEPKERERCQRKPFEEPQQEKKKIGIWELQCVSDPSKTAKDDKKELKTGKGSRKTQITVFLVFTPLLDGQKRQKRG
jgi:hypothetical protein